MSQEPTTGWPQGTPEIPANSTLGQMFASPTDELKPFLREVAVTLQVLQRRLDDLQARLEKLEQDRASSPGWYMDEGE